MSNARIQSWLTCHGRQDRFPSASMQERGHVHNVVWEFLKNQGPKYRPKMVRFWFKGTHRQDPKLIETAVWYRLEPVVAPVVPQLFHQKWWEANLSRLQRSWAPSSGVGACNCVCLFRARRILPPFGLWPARRPDSRIEQSDMHTL